MEGMQGDAGDTMPDLDREGPERPRGSEIGPEWKCGKPSGLVTDLLGSDGSFTMYKGHVCVQEGILTHLTPPLGTSVPAQGIT